MWPNPQEAAGLVTFTEEILNEKFFKVSDAVCSATFKVSGTESGKSVMGLKSCYKYLVWQSLYTEYVWNPQ